MRIVPIDASKKLKTAVVRSKALRSIDRAFCRLAPSYISNKDDCNYGH